MLTPPAMADHKSGDRALVLENRHTGERLALSRIATDGQICLSLRGVLPPHRPGPPRHVHYEEEEEFRVVAGVLSAEVDGHQINVRAGGSAIFSPGSVHRWWNEGSETLVLEGLVKPAVDLDRYLHAAFDVLNSGAPDRPPLFYMAHLARRHRQTQAFLFIPRPIQAVVLPLIVLAGTILGRYRGSDWPGSPARCTGVPLIAEEHV
jgi:mannose-6-phosphate isomerase-like protein (cupin superfamily)